MELRCRRCSKRITHRDKRRRGFEKDGLCVSCHLLTLFKKSLRGNMRIHHKPLIEHYQVRRKINV